MSPICYATSGTRWLASTHESLENTHSSPLRPQTCRGTLFRRCWLQAFPLDDSAGSPERLRSNGAGSLSSFPVMDAISPFYGGSEEMHWSVDGREETGLHDCGGLTCGVVVNVGSPQGPSQRRRVSVSFDESKAARRQRILEQVCLRCG